MNLFHRAIYFSCLILFPGCNNDRYQAYQDIQTLSDKGGFYGRSGPFALNSPNGQYRMKSFPYEHINVIFGDLCSGITKVYNTSNDSLLYRIDRYFGPDNTFLSNDGTGIAYVNNYWRGSDYDSCSLNILEFYKNGILQSAYSYFDLLGIQPDENELFWLFYDPANEWLTKNNHYQIDDELYLIPRKTGNIFVFDIASAKLKDQIDSTRFLNNLKFYPFPKDIIKIFRPQEVDSLPNLISGETFRHSISRALNVELIATDKDGAPGEYYFYIKVKANIDTSGSCLEHNVFSNEFVLTETAKQLKEKISDFLDSSSFAIDTLPYSLDYWLYEDRFYVAREPQTLAKSDYKQYRVEVCQIDSIDGNYIPKNLGDAMEELDKILDDSTKAMVRRGEESHFGVGMWLRNNWGLWAGGRLKCYFEMRHLHHPDFISGLILSGYYQRLNGQSFDGDSLIRAIAKEEAKWRRE